MMSNENEPARDVDRTRLHGFLQLLTAPNGELPEATPEILAFLKHAAKREEVPVDEVVRLAEHARRRVLADRLKGADVAAARTLGLQLRAKRAEAGIGTGPVASALKLKQSEYQEIEGERKSPLSLSAEVLARIAELFNLSLWELRRSLILSLQGPQVGHRPGLARSEQDDFTDDFLVVAERDLLRETNRAKEPPKESDLALLEQKLADVGQILEARAGD